MMKVVKILILRFLQGYFPFSLVTSFGFLSKVMLVFDKSADVSKVTLHF